MRAASIRFREPMATIPENPVSPREFIEDVVPALFADADVATLGHDDFDYKVGVLLSGDDGGAWTLHFVGAELGILSEHAANCHVTIVQSVADWRAALWEGRPALVADGVNALREGGVSGLRAARGADMTQGNPAALRELENLPGRIDAIVAGEEDPDWSVGIHIGPGPIAEEPAATIRIGATEADALRTGELHPLEALMTGQLRLVGVFGLILQLQAIAMAASMPPPPST